MDKDKNQSGGPQLCGAERYISTTKKLATTTSHCHNFWLLLCLFLSEPELDHVSHSMTQSHRSEFIVMIFWLYDDPKHLQLKEGILKVLL